MKRYSYIGLFFLWYNCGAPFHPDIIIQTSNAVRPKISVKLPQNIIESIQTENGKISNQEGSRFLALYLIENDKTVENRIIGQYELRNDSLVYIPSFDLDYNLTFEVCFYTKNNIIRKRYTVPERIISESLSEVKTIYPLSDNIPGNLLTFHVFFSSPMQMDVEAFNKIHLLDDKGNIKTKVWKEKSNWVNNQHLALMIHPGRIKRDIHYLEELGDVFNLGKQYTLMITPQLRDQYGRGLKKEYKKIITILPPDRMLPKIEFSKFRKPRLNSIDPLTLVFSEPMDYGTLIPGIEIFEENGNKITGQLTAVNDDMHWQFIPEEKWKNITYHLEFNTCVGDLANNYLHRPFEVKEIKAHYPGMPIKWDFKPSN